MSTPKKHRRTRAAIEVPLRSIKRPRRTRRDLGDVDALARSISDIGLLHPVVVTRDKRLVAGERRMAAYRKLNRKSIPASVVEHLDEALDLLRAERDENACRKDLAPTEIHELTERLRPLEEQAAEARRRQGQRNGGRSSGRQPSPRMARGQIAHNLSKPPKRKPKRVRDELAAAAGISGRQLEKLDEIMAAAQEDPEIWAPVVEEMDRTGNITKAYRVLQRQKDKEVLCQQGKPTPVSRSRRWSVIYGDPPWKYEHDITPERSLDRQYPQMGLDAICRLKVGTRKVENITTSRAMLLLWVPAAILQQGFEVMAAWGFDYRTNLTWDKEIMGMGVYVRQQHEHLLIGARGKPIRPEFQPRSIVRARRPSKHSQKPDKFRKLIEKMYPGLPRIELFARERHEGWDVFGNEV